MMVVRDKQKTDSVFYFFEKNATWNKIRNLHPAYGSKKFLSSVFGDAIRI